MGIKGIYAEIGQGERVSLSKLAVASIENKGRPLRIAVDISIWQFQNQAGKGGSNPALRTLYFRLLSLLRLSIQPLFVFDGPNKPPFKRNKRTGTGGQSAADTSTKELLGLLGFPFHIAPGEGEAECALLQREGIVDAVLSEDVDTLMFGCGRTFRDWSSKQRMGKGAPTHVSVYDVQDIQKRTPGLDREGMVLIALMSGGDYNTAGIRQCGIKVACEAAGAGFGKSLCALSRSDQAGLQKWREELSHELQTNEKRYFRVKHKALQVAPSFPDKEILNYYTHPIVSSADQITQLKESIKWDEVDVPRLRVFVASKFEWTGISGVHKFIRRLAPALISNALRTGQSHIAGTEIVKGIWGRRQHVSTDKLPELCLTYYPKDVVGLGLSAELDGYDDTGRDGLERSDEHASDEEEFEDKRSSSTSPIKRKEPRYDPKALQKVWIPEVIVRLGLPIIVEIYEESQRSVQKPRKAVKTSSIKGGMPRGAIERYIITDTRMINPHTIKNSEELKKPSSKGSGDPLIFPAADLEQSASKACEPCQNAEIKNTIPLKGQKPTARQQYRESGPAAKKRSTQSGNPRTSAQTTSMERRHSPRLQFHITKPAVPSGKSQPSLLPQKLLEEPPEVQSCFDYPASSQPPRKKLSHSNTPLSSIPPASTSIFSHLISSEEVQSELPPLPFGSSDMHPTLATSNLQQLRSKHGPIYISSSSPSVTYPSPLPASRALENLDFPRMRSLSSNMNQESARARFVMLRDSLEGAWKEVSGDESKPTQERGRTRAWRASAVEVLDMTSDQVAERIPTEQ